MSGSVDAVIQAADRLLECLNEFGDCKYCGEYADILGRRIDAVKRGGMSDATVQLIPWGKSTATALLQQAEARRREAEREGEEFVLVMAWAKKSPGGNWRYTEAWTTGPNEVLFYVAHSLREQLKP